MRILLTGSKGQVGQCFKDRLPEDWELIATDSKTLDITDAGSVLNMVKTFEPDAVINTAAYTQVDRSESNAALAFAVNASGTLNLARAAKAVRARFIHLSTDYVFDGSHNCPIDENTPPNPLNVYGHSKLAGESLALAAHTDTLILRTSWVYSEYGHNFVKSMLQMGLEKTHIDIVADQTGCPTYAGDLAQVMVTILQHPDPLRGLYHYSSGHALSWYEFAQQVYAVAGEQNPHYRQMNVHAIRTADWPTEAKRPAYTVLNSHALLNILPAITPTPLTQTIARLLAQHA